MLTHEPRSVHRTMVRGIKRAWLSALDVTIPPSARRGLNRSNGLDFETRYASAQPSLWAQKVFTSKIVWAKSHWPSRFTSRSS